MTEIPETSPQEVGRGQGQGIGPARRAGVGRDEGGGPADATAVGRARACGSVRGDRGR